MRETITVPGLVVELQTTLASHSRLSERPDRWAAFAQAVRAEALRFSAEMGLEEEPLTFLRKSYKNSSK